MNWYKSYLSGRYQCAKINKAKSDNKATICGVPHGHVLGPLLFLIFIYDIYKPMIYINPNRKWKLRSIFLLTTLQNG